MPRITELAYVADVAPLFEALRCEPWAALLESGHALGHPDARYDILVADPHVTLTTRGESTLIDRRGRIERSSRPPLELLRELLGERAAPVDALPFAGGALGYFAYDFGRLLERLPSIARGDIALPEVALGVYDWAVVVDHVARRSWIVGQGRDPRTFAQWDARLARLERPEPGRGSAAQPFTVLSAPRASFDRISYGEAFERVKAHIRAGDCYQVNLTQRFTARVAGDSWQAYRALRRINPAPFAAFLEYPDGAAVLSSSPERFLRVRGGHVETKPIKGTRPRAADAARDRAFAEELRRSPKDRAENVMIVDLLRNDLGKSCAAGSIRATKLFDVESFASVHHLVSTVEGTLAPGKDALDLLGGCFPGGSITGAPKLAAMQVIETLEPHRRSVYCGCIGYVGFDGDMDTNIAIRTLVRHGELIHAWAGGGVVADSEVEAEYQESLTKAAALLEVLGGDRGQRPDET